MSPVSQTPKILQDKEFIEDIISYMEDITNKEIYYFQKWNFSINPFDQRPFQGDQTSVKARRNNVFKNMIKELLLSFSSYDHILIKAPAGAGKTFLLQEMFALLNTPNVNKALVKSLRERETCNIAFIDGFQLKDLDSQERLHYLIESGICNEKGTTIADIILIDNFAPIHKFWHILYPKYFGQSFLIATIQTSEYFYLEALLNQDIELPFKENMLDETQIQLKMSDPLEIFTKQVELPEWTTEELKELLSMRILESGNEQISQRFDENFLSFLAKNSLGLPGLCLDLALNIMKNAITNDLHDLKSESIYKSYIDQKFSKATAILIAFKCKDNPKLLKQFDESTIAIINQLTKKTRKDFIKRLLISIGGYHIQTKQKWTIGTELDDYFTINDTNKANDLASSLSPTKLAIVLDKTQSTLSYHLNWFQNEEMIDIITTNAISPLKKSQLSFDKIILPPSPYAQLFEILLQISP